MRTLRQDESACCSHDKTDKMCTDCIRNLEQFEIPDMQVWSEFTIVKKFVDGKIVKTCKGYLE